MQFESDSNTLTRPVLFHYLAQRTDLERMAVAVFDAVTQGVLTIEPGKVFSLAAAAAAHEVLE